MNNLLSLVILIFGPIVFAQSSTHQNILHIPTDGLTHNRISIKDIFLSHNGIGVHNDATIQLLGKQGLIKSNTVQSDTIESNILQAHTSATIRDLLVNNSTTLQQHKCTSPDPNRPYCLLTTDPIGKIHTINNLNQIYLSNSDTVFKRSTNNTDAYFADLQGNLASVGKNHQILRIGINTGQKNTLKDDAALLVGGSLETRGGVLIKKIDHIRANTGANMNINIDNATYTKLDTTVNDGTITFESEKKYKDQQYPTQFIFTNTSSEHNTKVGINTDNPRSSLHVEGSPLEQEERIILNSTDQKNYAFTVKGKTLLNGYTEVAQSKTFSVGNTSCPNPEVNKACYTNLAPQHKWKPTLLANDAIKQVGIGVSDPDTSLTVSANPNAIEAEGDHDGKIRIGTLTHLPYGVDIRKNWPLLRNHPDMVGVSVTKNTDFMLLGLVPGEASSSGRQISVLGWGDDHNDDLEFRFYDRTDDIHKTYMTLKPKGNVGIGTQSPTEKLHVNGNIKARGNLITEGNNIHIIRPDAPGGFARGLQMINPNGGGPEATMGFLGAGNQTSAIYFGYGDNARDNPGLTVNKARKVGIGMSAWTEPEAKLDVRGDARIEAGIKVGGTRGVWLGGKLNHSMIEALTPQHNDHYSPYLKQTMANGNVVNLGGLGNRFGFLSYNADRTANGVDHFLLTMDSVNGNVGIGTFGPEEKLHVNGNVRANAYFYNSDKRYKTDIQPLESALAKITSIGGYKYFNTLTKKNDIGLIAQDIEHTFPELVATDAQGYKTVAYANLVAPLVEAIKELNTTVQHLFDQYLSQQAQIDELRNELQLLKNQINS